MPTFYVGKRPVLKGRNGEIVNPYTGKVGVYSNWLIFSPDHVLDGAPDNNHVPGTGYSPHGYQLSRSYTGLSDQNNKNSLNLAGLGPRQDPYYFRQQPYLYKGLAGAQVFSAAFGHVQGGGVLADYAVYSNYEYHGIGTRKSEPLAEPGMGHPQEAYGTHYAFFGPTRPYEYQGPLTAKSEPLMSVNVGHQEYRPSLVADAMPSDYGQIPAARASVEHYGFEHPLEWFGVPSAKAL